ncbi:MAG: rhomboid family intramembrane serine protease [Phycisphaerae bacterium]|nr:rhomboid family intramembrane serine protease [Phycisphaerae bacterium]
MLFLIVAALDLTGLASRQQTLSFLGLSYVGVVERFWVHQFLTAPLLHANVAHLLFNMLSLWMLGPDVERALGRQGYIGFSAVCAMCSMVGFLLINWRSGSIVMGYSGVIFGILVAQAMLFPGNRIALFAFFPMKMKHAVLLLGAVELYLTISPEGGGVAHAAHLFGAVAALVYLKVHRWREARTSRIRVAGQAKPRACGRRQRIKREIPQEL